MHIYIYIYISTYLYRNPEPTPTVVPPPVVPASGLLRANYHTPEITKVKFH